MDAINFSGVVTLFSAFGPIGLVVLVWYCDMKVIRKQHQSHKDDITKILNHYKDDMAEIRRMYENNVKLVEGYESLAKDLKDLVVLNTQQMTHVSDQIDQNEFCPMQRIKKKTVIKEAGG